MVRAKGWVLIGVLIVGGCHRARYQPPAVPGNQLAIVTVDQRATLVAVEKLPVTEYAAQKPPDRVFVAAGCRHVSATYQATYFQLGKGGSFHEDSVADHLEKIGGTERHSYETDEPIHFYFPAKAGMTYWVTASFNGDEFMPRLVEFDAAGERKGAFYPNSPCSADSMPSKK
jgi:hypothetical protein